MSDMAGGDRAMYLMNAALDGELDAMGALEFERAVAADAALKARYDQLTALRGALRGRAGDMRASDALRAKIEAAALREAAASEPATAPAPIGVFRARPRAALAATLLLGLAGGFQMASFTRGRPPPGAERVAMLLVDDHRRSLLASEQIDVASSDRHTVKPWFDARLALSPPVVDLSARGIVLVGGRADVVQGTPAPTIVYRAREHFISLTALPAARFSAASAGAMVDGYETETWSDGAFIYWAVSDIPRPDLEAFVAAFREGAAANVENH